MIASIKMTKRSHASHRTTKRTARTAGQLELQLERRWGGRREGAGRKPSGRRVGVAHRARPEHKRRHPVHVTLRVRGRLPSMREQVLFFEIRRCISLASRREYRVLHFSVQSDHVHLVVEADDKRALWCGTTGLEVRVARRLNTLLGKKGRFWGDRYHARALGTPREVRHAIVYVLMNWKKHAPNARAFDPCSSAWWFNGWTEPPRSRPPGWRDAPPVEKPSVWLAREGWARGGRIDPSERPRDDP
jgi:putative transposase